MNTPPSFRSLVLGLALVSVGSGLTTRFLVAATSWPHFAALVSPTSSVSSFAVPRTVPQPPRDDESGVPRSASRSDDREPMVHLLSNDRVLHGRLTRRGDVVLIERDTIQARLPATQLVASFANLDELYRYRLRSLPVNDPDEQLKMARWCLANDLRAQARAHLEAVLRLAPDHREASAMLNGLEVAERRADGNRRDPEVRAAAIDAGGPAPLSAASGDAADRRRDALERAREFAGATGGAPILFDLPPGLALKRTQEFANVVHPILQRKCAGCHHERQQSDFQLIQVASRRELTRDVLLYNLDATTRLIDPDDPIRSPLLIASLMPHKPTNKPILNGQNDPSYRVLWSWINLVKSSRPGASASGALGRISSALSSGMVGGEPALPPSETFAADRALPAMPSGSSAPLPDLSEVPVASSGPRLKGGLGAVPASTPGAAPGSGSTPPAPFPVPDLIPERPDPSASTPPPPPSAPPSLGAKRLDRKQEEDVRPKVKIDTRSLEEFFRKRNTNPPGSG